MKLRKNTDFGPPEAFVDEKKQGLLTRAAIAYCEANDYEGEIRFDVISIIGEQGKSYEIQHLEDAFFPGLS